MFPAPGPKFLCIRLLVRSKFDEGAGRFPPLCMWHRNNGNNFNSGMPVQSLFNFD